MDALYPRLLVDDFAGCWRFYDALATGVLGGRRVKGHADAYYAQWDLGGEALLVLYRRERMRAALPVGEQGAGRRDAVMLVLRVDDVDAAFAGAVEAGGRVVAPPRDRPEWAAGLRTAHVRDPDGNLVEFQSY